jgi:hypothetical protein
MVQLSKAVTFVEKYGFEYIYKWIEGPVADFVNTMTNHDVPRKGGNLAKGKTVRLNNLS